MASERGTLSLPQLGAVVAGNALEFYDFLTFSFFAVQIGAVLFPGRDATDSLLLTLATFGVGFLTRPLGGLVIGTLGDTWGRKPAMLFSFGLMGASVVGLALTPSYASIGMAAPLLAVLFRLMQGFALGGEVGPTTAFLLEVAPMHRRGLYVSLQNATQYLSTLCAGLVGMVLANTLSPEALTAWGWRVALLIGAAVVPFALIIRRRLPETLRPTYSPAARRRGATRGLLVLSVMGLFMLAAATIATYTMNYMSTFAIHTLGFPPGKAFAATIATGSCAMTGALLGGFFSDKVGRKPLMIGGAIGLLATGLPSFMLMANSHSLLALVLGSAAMSLCVGLFVGPVMVSLTESMPTSLRAGSVGILYALAIAGFGGSAQFVVTWLIDVTGSPLAPAWYMSGAMLVGLAAMVGMRESAPIRTGRLKG
jgi:MHS family citrate/tricarballylate:H+ symporter-like MFS transporter